jgi:hypothetical protein
MPLIPLAGEAERSKSGSPPFPWTFFILATIMILGLAFHILGLRRDLPYSPDSDEALFVRPAVLIASTLDLNPHWFGNPGSTVIYPLALLVRVAHSSLGLPPQPDTQLQSVFAASPGSFYLLGRILTIAYAVVSLPLIYLVGRRAFCAPVGLAAAWLFCCYPVAVTYAQYVRTDSAGVFWTMLSVYFCLRLLDEPRPRWQFLAGLAIGLGISTRYFMVTLLSLLLAVNWLLWLRDPQHNWQLAIGRVALGLTATAISFALTSPYFFLDAQQALASLRLENRPTHPGADGLTPLGNLLWYLRRRFWQPLALAWQLRSDTLRDA